MDCRSHASLTSEISRAGGIVQLTIDAGGAASSMINFSMNSLARLSQAGIEPTTFGWAILAGSHIIWSIRGLERFKVALESGV